MLTIRRLLLCIFLLAGEYGVSAPKPKLIVVISLDQFRYDYLTKFDSYYGAHGFRYLMRNGASFTNAVYKHAFNMTGPGHAVILTGVYGNVNGITVNTWYDQSSRQAMYCVADKSVSTVGASGEGRSPANLIVPTFGDELRLHTGFTSKVISISHKDRAAILMGGKMATGAFWMVDSTFVTSSFYMNSLPAWVQKFNASGVANSYFGKTWNRVLPDDAYTMMDNDDVAYESTRSTIGRAFPHLIRGDDPAHITKSYYTALLTSPFGMEVLSAFAKASIEGEQLGKGRFPDLLCIGFSSTDIVGHSFGPHSREIMEMAVQTDRVLADLFAYLDARIGLKNTIIVLTSDHGVTPIPEYMRSRYPGADAGRLSYRTLEETSNSSLVNTFGAAGNGKKWIAWVADGNIYLDHAVVTEKKLDPGRVAAVLADSVMNLHEIALALAGHALMAGSSGLEGKMKRSFHAKRSGDVMFVLRPFYYQDDGTDGADHGNPYDHDAHVPLMIAGEGIRRGSYATETSPADIGPTLSAMLGIEFPAAREGRILLEALKSHKE